MSRLAAAFAAALATTLSLSLALATPAYAHERRNVGPYQFVVGWLNEPAFQAQPNAASVRITDTRATPAKAVEGLEKTLTIQVSAGGLSPYTGSVRTVFGQPGLYALDLIPTQAGAYTFTIGGKVESLDVNETFESGPGRFDDVKGATALQYPAKVPEGSDLSDRLAAIDRDLGSIRGIAIVALVLAIVLPLGNAVMRRRPR